MLNHIPAGAAAECRSRINLNAWPRGRRNNGRGPGVGRRLGRDRPCGAEDREAGGADGRDQAQACHRGNGRDQSGRDTAQILRNNEGLNQNVFIYGRESSLVGRYRRQWLPEPP